MWKFLAVVILLLVSACQSAAAPVASAPELVAVADGSYQNISVETLHDMLASKSFLLVDLHTPNEGHLAQTDLRIPYNAI